MLEAGNYEGGGCAEVFPSEAAPPNADWTLYCLGYCMCQPGGDTVMGACEAVPFINETTEPPAFDLSAVQTHFATECGAPSPRFDDRFCQTVRPDRLEGEGGALFVRTTLRGRDYDFAVAICVQLAGAHFDSVGRDLGYMSVTIVKENGGEHFLGGNAAHCAVRRQ
jgi:hypothetical protein